MEFPGLSSSDVPSTEVAMIVYGARGSLCPYKCLIGAHLACLGFPPLGSNSFYLFELVHCSKQRMCTCIQVHVSKSKSIPIYLYVYIYVCVLTYLLIYLLICLSSLCIYLSVYLSIPMYMYIYRETSAISKESICGVISDLLLTSISKHQLS